MLKAESRLNPVDRIGPLLEGREALIGAFRRRKDTYEYSKVHPEEELKFSKHGWVVHKRAQSHLWVKRLKSLDRLLQDKIWCLFYKMGYPVLNDRNAQIFFKQIDGSSGSKQIDVFAKDDDTTVIVECKARETRGRRGLQKDIQETERHQKKYSQVIRSHFGPGYTPKIIWIYATNNIIWSEADVERAEAANIKIITENELHYFETFISHIGSAGKYQFLAEFLEGKEIPNLQNIMVPAVKGKLGTVTYYNFVVSARHLLKIAFVNHQALNHPDGRPAYQRMINKKRIADIGAFIRSGGYFPTNILVNFVEQCRFDLLPNKENADKNVKFGWLYLPSKYKSAWVIDGQHRLYGFSNLQDMYLENNLFVLAFEKMDTKTEAELFVTINHEQRSVPKSLLVTLQADLRIGSDNPREAISAVASAVIRGVNNDNTSPFFRRFSNPGVPPAETQNLTIAEAVKGLVRSNLVGRVLPKKSRVPGFLSGLTDVDTVSKARRVLNGYFRAIMEASPERWEKGRAAYICVNPGIRAHFQLIQEILHYLSNKGTIDPATDNSDNICRSLVEFVEPVREFIAKASDKQIEQKFARKFGEGGVTEYFYNLCELVQKKHKDFGGQEYRKYKERQADARIHQADQDLNDLQNYISEVVIETLKKAHGTHELPSGEKAYWDVGIDNLDIKQNAYKKQQMAPSERRAPKEAYLDLVDFEKIIKQGNNWASFEPIFNIALIGEKGKKYYLTWLERLNEIRRIGAHKSPYRSYSEEDLEFVNWIKGQLYEKFISAGFEID